MIYISPIYSFQDGYLTSEEMKDILLDQGLHMSQQEVEDFIKEADINGTILGFCDHDTVKVMATLITKLLLVF